MPFLPNLSQKKVIASGGGYVDTGKFRVFNRQSEKGHAMGVTIRSIPGLVLMMWICSAGVCYGDDDSTTTATADTKVNPRWLQKLDELDRSLLNELIGYAPPAFPDTLTWYESSAQTWDALVGKVVVLQSWTNKSSAARGRPRVAQRVLKKWAEDDDLQILALHTPEGADRAEKFLQKQELGMPVIVDATGAYCDELGIYKKPVNILVDRQGAVRYVGLNNRGLVAAVEQLLAETYDETKKASERTKEETEAPELVDYPPHSRNAGSALNIQGKSAPRFYVDEWVTAAPDLRNKVVVIDFWATWCPPCRATIPHLNALANQFSPQAGFVGISAEKEYDFERGMRKYDLKLENFRYALAIDPSRSMYQQIQIKGIPNCIVMSRDWIVRWQGHPSNLTPDILSQIIEADKSQQNAQTSQNAQRYRWTGGETG